MENNENLPIQLYHCSLTIRKQIYESLVSCYLFGKFGTEINLRIVMALTNVTEYCLV